MPYVSKAQEAYFNANKAKLQKQGVNVNEWNTVSKGKKLPGYKLNPQNPNSYKPKKI
jgi:hypothetical protein